LSFGVIAQTYPTLINRNTDTHQHRFRGTCRRMDSRRYRYSVSRGLGFGGYCAWSGVWGLGSLFWRMATGAEKKTSRFCFCFHTCTLAMQCAHMRQRLRVTLCICVMGHGVHNTQNPHRPLPRANLSVLARSRCCAAASLRRALRLHLPRRPRVVRQASVAQYSYVRRRMSCTTSICCLLVLVSSPGPDSRGAGFTTYTCIRCTAGWGYRVGMAIKTSIETHDIFVFICFALNTL
jgi:hypothetical protein